MKKDKQARIVLKIMAVLITCLAFNAAANDVPAQLPKPDDGKKPLKVYIMAGQSNMQGHGHFKTFEHIGMDPKTAPMLKKMVNEDGTAKEIDQAWISALGIRKDGSEVHGKLTAGFGAGWGGGPKIGPEFTFGIYMQEHVKEPILIIKTAFGGRSLNTDFRSPSAGAFKLSEQSAAEFKAKNKNVEEFEKKRNEVAGFYYRKMMTHINSVLADIKRVCPVYDPKQGYEVAGFMWFQGVHDFGDSAVYPNLGKPGCYDEYSRLLTCFIRDVRKDLNTPNMPFVIGVLGINGDLSDKKDDKYTSWISEFRKAMAAPTTMPECKGNVAAVHTEKFWEPKLDELQSRWGKIKAKDSELKKEQTANAKGKVNLRRVRLTAENKAKLEAYKKTIYTEDELELMKVGTSNAGYHYMGSAKILARIGKAFAEAITGMSGSNPAKKQQALFPGKKSLFGDKFTMYKNGRDIVVVPQKIAKGKPWVWRARFWRHEPQFDIAMLEKGYHIVYCDVGGLLGNPTAVERWNKYHQWLTEEHGFAKKAVLEGMSRGGLIIYNWAIANPDKVAAIYGDAPVMDLRSWPGAGNKGTLRTYKFKDAEESKAYKGYPVDNLKPLAKAGVPIIHVVGDTDKVVPVSENTAVAEKRYKKLGGTIEVIHKKDTGHHPHSLKDPAPLVAFIEQ